MSRRHVLWVLIVLSMSLALPLAARAAEPASLSGKITDGAGAPVAEAEVSVAELKLRTTSGTDGSFTFAGLPAGRYTISVRRQGFAPAVVPVTVPAASPLAVSLTTTPFEIAPLDVTGSRGPNDPARSPQATASLSGDAVQKERSVSLAHAIDALPGMRTISTGEQVGKPVIRGLSGPRVLVLEDGYRLEDYSWSDEDGPSVDARLTDRVEVIRGPASVLYGSDAMGGVVNAVPADLPDARARAAFTKGGVELYGASNNAEFGTALRLEHASGNFGSRIFAVGRHGADIHTPDGEIPNTGFGAFNGEVALGLRGDKGNGTLRVAHYGGEFKLLEADKPAEDTGNPEEEGGPERKAGDNRVQFGSNLLLGGVRLETKAQWQGHSLIEVADSAGVPGTESDQFNLMLNTFTLDVIAHHGDKPVHGAIGVSGLYQTNDSRGPIALVPDATANSGALYAFEEWDRGRLGLSAGGRVDFHHLKNDANADLALAEHSRDDTQGSADLGLVYGLNGGWSLAANAARGWRAPSLFELYSNGPQLSEARYDVGNPDLDPENDLEFDAGIRLHKSKVRAELTGFSSKIENYIYLSPTGGSQVVDADTLAVYAYQQADSKLRGGEFWAQLEAAKPLTLRARTDYVWGQNEQTDQPLPLMPPWRVAGEAELHSSTLSWAERGNVGVEVEHIADQTRLGPFDVPTGDYTLVHLDAGMAKRLGSHTYEFNLRVRNVGDVAYRSFLSRYKKFADDPGRNVVFSVSTGL